MLYLLEDTSGTVMNCYLQGVELRAWLQAVTARCSGSSPLAEGGYLSSIRRRSPKPLHRHRAPLQCSLPGEGSQPCPIIHLQKLPEDQCSHCGTAGGDARAASQQLVQPCPSSLNAGMKEECSPLIQWQSASESRCGYLLSSPRNMLLGAKAARQSLTTTTPISHFVATTIY